MIPTLWSFIAPPLLHFPGGVLITACQTMAVVTSYEHETNPTTRIPYSKFFNNNNNKNTTAKENNNSSSSQQQQQQQMTTTTTIGSKLGFSIMYGLPLVTMTVLCGLQCRSSNQHQPVWVGSLITFHFAKRLLEVQWVHQYSGRIALVTSVGIGIYYALVSAFMTILATTTTTTRPHTQTCSILGTSLFVLGSIGNFYHHWLLRTLRTKKSSTTATTATSPQQSSSYVMPHGGLFAYVAAPHYLFELIAWWGLAITSQHANGYLVAAAMSSYLAGRAVAQNQWNTTQFPQWVNNKNHQPNRKNLIPFVF